MDFVFEFLIVYFIWLSFNFYFHIYLNFFLLCKFLSSMLYFIELCSSDFIEYLVFSSDWF